MSGMGIDYCFVLQSISFALVEKVLSTVLPVQLAVGVHAVTIVDPSIYVGAQIVVGVLGTNTQEVVTVSAITDVDFTATFTRPHLAGEPVRSATFPSGQINQLSSPNIAPN